LEETPLLVGLLERFLVDLLPATRCCGGLFATTSTARSKRDHASGLTSGVEVLPLESCLAMKVPRKPKRLIVSRASQSHLVAIGNIVVNWAAVEDLLNVVIIQMFMKTGYLGRIVLAQMDYRDKRNILLALVSRMPDENPLKQKLETLLPKLHTAHGMRSIVAHAFWTKGRKLGAIKPMRFEARGSIKMSGHHHNEPNYTAKSLSQEAEKIGLLYKEVNDLIDWVAWTADSTAINSLSTSESKAESM
jgi:hypothetical protein